MTRWAVETMIFNNGRFVVIKLRKAEDGERDYRNEIGSCDVFDNYQEAVEFLAKYRRA